MQCSTIQYSTMQCNAIPCNTVQRCATQCNAVQNVLGMIDRHSFFEDEYVACMKRARHSHSCFNSDIILVCDCSLVKYCCMKRNCLCFCFSLMSDDMVSNITNWIVHSILRSQNSQQLCFHVFELSSYCFIHIACISFSKFHTLTWHHSTSHHPNVPCL